MARDYKNTPKNKRKSGDSGGGISGILTFAAGLITGLCVVIVMYLLDTIPDLDRLETQPNSPPPALIEEPAESEPEQPEKASEPEQSTGPKFDFYTILPEMEVSVPEWEASPPPLPSESPAEPETEAEAAAEAEPEDSPPAPPVEDDRYILQIGSFRQPDEADRVKAKLALLGLNTEIQRVVIDGGDVWHRVRAGPYQNAEALNQARQRLIDNNIDFMLLKLKHDSG